MSSKTAEIPSGVICLAEGPVGKETRQYKENIAEVRIGHIHSQDLLQKRQREAMEDVYCLLRIEGPFAGNRVPQLVHNLCYC